MMDKKNIMKMAEDVFHHSQGYKDRRMMHPQREWSIGIVFFAVIVIGGSIFTSNIFVSYENIDKIQGNSIESIPEYQNEVVQHALDIYRERMHAYTALQYPKAQLSVLTESSSTVKILPEDIPAGVPALE